MSDVRDVGAPTQVWPLRPTGEDRKPPPPPPARRRKTRERPAAEQGEGRARDGGVDEYV